MTSIEPARSTPPAVTGHAPGFLALAGEVTALTVQALRLKENLHRFQQRMANNAAKGHTLAEMCHTAGVEPRFTARIHEAGTHLQKAATASGDVAATADTVHARAAAFGAAHRAEYSGVYEAVKASGVQQPKPGFNRVR